MGLVSKDKADLVSISVIKLGEDGKQKTEEYPGTHSEFYNSLLEKGPFVYGDHGQQPGENKFDWLDENKIKKGQAFIRRNFFSIMFSHFLSLLLIFCFKSGRAVLLRTGESHKRDNSLTRYLSTVLHVKLWYETDFIIEKSKTYQDIYAVRKMHRAAAINYEKAKTPVVYMNDSQEALLNAIQEDCKNIETKDTPWDLLVETPEVPMSQFDMVITQYCFLGFVNLHPKMFGIWEDDEEGMDGFVHMWAAIGRLLGIDDKYNLALHANDRVAYSKIWNNIFLASYKSIDKYTILMWDSLVYGLSFYFPFLRLNSVTLFLLTEIAKLPMAKNVSGICSYYDKLIYTFMKAAVSLSRFTIVRMFLNTFVRFSIYMGRIRYMRGGQHLTPPSEDKKPKKALENVVVVETDVKKLEKVLEPEDEEKEGKSIETDEIKKEENVTNNESEVI